MMLVRELRRKPVPFLVPIGVLMLLAVLLLFPSAVLDGLLRNSSEVLRRAPADLIVYSWDANGMQTLSQLDPQQRATVEQVSGVDQVAGFNAWAIGANFEGGEATSGITLVTSEGSFTGSVPEPGKALVDHSLRDDEGLSEGSLLLLGTNKVAVTIAGFLPDMMLWGLPGVLVDKTTYDAATDLSGLLAPSEVSPDQAPEEGQPPDQPSDGVEPPDQPSEEGQPPDQPSDGVEPPDQPSEEGQPPQGFQLLPEDMEDGTDGGGTPPGGAETPDGQPGPAQEATQVLFVGLDRGANPESVAAAIDSSTDGSTETFTKSGAIKAIPGVEEQQLIFMFIQVVTLTVALFVVGLFVMFLTLERTPFYAVLKAVGASSSQIFSGVIFQALLISGIAVGLGTAITWGLTHIPLGLPTEMQLTRLLETLVILTAATILGSVLSLFRVARIDPAKAIS